MTKEYVGFKVGLSNIFENTKKENKLKEDDPITLKHEQLVSGKYQPRKLISQESLNELAESIRSQGVIQPIIVRPIDHNRYEIIAGERRWRASQLAGLKDVPVVVRDVPDNAAIAMALIENIQREDLNIMEEADALKRLQDEFKLTQQEVSQAVGKSRVTVTHTLRLLELHPEIQKYLYEGKMDRGHAKALFSLEGEQLIFCANQIVEKGLSVRQAEELVQRIKAGLSLDKNQDQNKYVEEISLYNKSLAEWNKVLSDKFSSLVHIKLNRKGEGRVTFQVDSMEELGWLVKAFTMD